MQKTILLTGITGQVGRDLGLLLPRLSLKIVAPKREELDLTKAGQIRHVIAEAKPHLIVNAAAYTAVDKAESDAATARAVNTDAVRIMAEEARKVGAALIHYSTDYVFAGTSTAPYTEDDAPNPQSIYGKTKLDGETAIRASGTPHLIFRTAWVYAREGRNFPLTILRLATQREELRIVRDQIGAPTLSREIAAATIDIIEQLIQKHPDPVRAFEDVSGVYHMTAGGKTSWYDFACAILEEAARARAQDWLTAATGGRRLIARSVVPITTAEYPTPAKRPHYSVLCCERLAKTFGRTLPHWREQLRSFFAAPASLQT